jgi:hypothetical protein
MPSGICARSCRRYRQLPPLRRAATKGPRAKPLKLADKTGNLRAGAASPPSDWSVKWRIEYVHWTELIVTWVLLASTSGSKFTPLELGELGALILVSFAEIRNGRS